MSAFVSIMELTKVNTHGFYFALEHKYNNIIEKWFKEYTPKYNVEEYVISWEIASDGKHQQTAGQHFHVLIFSPTSNDITKTSDNMKKSLKKHLETSLQMKFLGKANNGDARQYGVASVGQLRNPNNYLSYLLKDKNPLNTITSKLHELSKTLPDWVEQPKEDKLEWFYDLQKLLTSKNLKLPNYDQLNSNYSLTQLIQIDPIKLFRKNIAIEILKIYKEKTLKPPTKSQMDAFVKYFMLHNSSVSENQFLDLWYYSEN